jgi:hypothetical protein
LELADQLLAGRDRMWTPQDLPGRYGRVVRSVDHVLGAMQCQAVVAGGWAVWRHGFVGRVTQDLDVVLPADRVEDFLKVAAVSGFEILSSVLGRWPKMTHNDTGVQVDILPEGARPGSPSKLAPTTIPHPSRLGAAGASLTYIDLPQLVELKLAAGRMRDEYDVVELIRANPDQLQPIRDHLAAVHADYAAAFEQLVKRAQEDLPR